LSFPIDGKQLDGQEPTAMELTLERPGDHLYVRSVTEHGIQIGDRLYPGPVIVSANDLLTDWNVAHPDDLTEEHLEPLFRLTPEIVIIGTGATQRLPHPELQMHFYRRQIGVEFMSTPAACRTFNVLVSERRRVVAALLPISSARPA